MLSVAALFDTSPAISYYTCSCPV